MTSDPTIEALKGEADPKAKAIIEQILSGVDGRAPND